MASHIYGSPFPTINPKVRYKTVLERAGFDVNYKGESLRAFSAGAKPNYPLNNSTSSLEREAPQAPHQSGNSAHSQSHDALNHLERKVQEPERQLFNFEKPGDGVEETDEVKVGTPMNPIEKSFMMLTKNDTSSVVNLKDTLGESTSFPQKDELSPQLEPKEELRIETPVLPQGPVIPQLKVTSNDLESMHGELRSVRNSSSASFVESLNCSSKIDNLEDSAQEDPTATITSTNLQVEKLIAQLDDVSFNRNAELGEKTSVPDAKPADLPASTAPDALSIGDGWQKFKKSSAYLSGYPSMSNHESGISSDFDRVSNITSQTLLLNDEASTNSKINEGTPVFYNFKENQRSKQNLAQQSEVRDSVDSRKTSKSSIPSKTTKYPPGEGPCRACGLQINDKRIFSKKDNELSGQWHRHCFKCIKCDLQFNKRTPCYILDDEPYCREHYHEANGSICKICKGFIEGECLENDRKERFHIDCLECFICQRSIRSDYYLFNDEVPICENHNLETLLVDGLPESDRSSQVLDNTVSKRTTRLINFHL